MQPPYPAPDTGLSRAPPSGLERRLTVRLENYWHALRWSERGPFFQDFHPDRNPVPWSNTFLAHLAGVPEEIRFEHVGKAILALFKPRGTNLPEREWLLQAIARHCGDMASTLGHAAPARREGSFTRHDGAEVKYRSLLLPFVDANREPRYLVGAVTYRLDLPPGVVIPLRRADR